MSATHSETAKLTAADVLAPDDYAARRREFRAQVLEYKRNRTLKLGAHVTLSFENRHTMRYQVQEMLREGGRFDARAVQDEIDACNPLIPDGSNWKATCFVEYPEKERAAALARLKDIERMFWVQVAELPRVSAIADEDLDRAGAEATSPVHFLRFELDALQVTVLRAGGAIQFGVDHPAYSCKVAAPAAVREALLADLA